MAPADTNAAGDEVAEANNRWSVSAMMSDITQAHPANDYTASMYAIHAGIAFDAFRMGITAQEAADTALKR